MNNDQLDDLKQFIAASVSQATANMATKDDLKDLATKDDASQIRGDLQRVEQKVDDGFAGVAEIVDEIHKQNDDFDTRLTRLEQQVA